MAFSCFLVDQSCSFFVVGYICWIFLQLNRHVSHGVPNTVAVRFFWSVVIMMGRDNITHSIPTSALSKPVEQICSDEAMHALELFTFLCPLLYGMPYLWLFVTSNFPTVVGCAAAYNAAIRNLHGSNFEALSSNNCLLSSLPEIEMYKDHCLRTHPWTERMYCHRKSWQTGCISGYNLSVSVIFTNTVDHTET